MFGSGFGFSAGSKTQIISTWTVWDFACNAQLFSCKYMKLTHEQWSPPTHPTHEQWPPTPTQSVRFPHTDLWGLRSSDEGRSIKKRAGTDEIHLPHLSCILRYGWHPLATSILHSSLWMTSAHHIYLTFFTTDDIHLPHLSSILHYRWHPPTTSISHSSLRMPSTCHIYLTFFTTDDIRPPHLSRILHYRWHILATSISHLHYRWHMLATSISHFSLRSDRLSESRSSTMPSKHHIHLVVLHSGQTDGQCLEAGKPKDQQTLTTSILYSFLLGSQSVVKNANNKQTLTTSVWKERLTMSTLQSSTLSGRVAESKDSPHLSCTPRSWADCRCTAAAQSPGETRSSPTPPAAHPPAGAAWSCLWSPGPVQHSDTMAARPVFNSSNTTGSEEPDW